MAKMPSVNKLTRKQVKLVQELYDLEYLLHNTWDRVEAGEGAKRIKLIQRELGMRIVSVKELKQLIASGSRP